MEYNRLTPDEEYVIVHKGTERPFSGKFNDFKDDGIFACRRCDAPLFRSRDKFESGSGWPSFDESIDASVKRVPDSDRRRVEIVCANCGGHLGHVFENEGFTNKNTRHCVNSLSLTFVREKGKFAYFAAGCFWGVEYLMQKKSGVISAVSGYMGGKTKDPTYEEVCYDDTGHLEVVKVEYNPKKISYEDLVKYFFEIHDPTQRNGQGPDIGDQYLSAVFVSEESEKKTCEKIIEELKAREYDIATTLKKMAPFYEAEEYHQNYYKKHGKEPYCHFYTPRF